MNKQLHKVIFNRNTGLMAVVAETAHNNGKSSKDKRFQVALFNFSGRLLTDLTAAKNVNIKAAKEIGKEHNNFENIHAAVGAAISFNGNGASIGVTAEGEYGKGKANGDNINYRNSHVGSSTGQTNISAGKELNINGGQVLGKGVKIDAQKLNIETVQNAMNYNSNQFNASVDFTIGYGASAGGNVSASKIKANYQSINEQSGIFAGDDGYQINIKDNTHLNGGLITSTANAEQNDKNRFETGTITFKDLANKAEYKGEAFGLGISGSVKGNNPNSNSSIYTVDKTGMSNTMGYGRDKESQSSITKAGINTANITIRDNEKQQQITGKTAEETKRAVKTDLTVENYAEHSGSLKNNFDKEKVQNEIDLQVEVTKEFSNNVRDFQSKQNKRLDELKAKKENGEISQKEYQEQTQKIERQKLITNVVAGGLLAPTDSVLGIATSTVAPAVSHKIGQYFKKEGKEGSFEHIATHAVIGAITASANGGNALAGAVSAGGAEYIAQVTANTLFNKKAEDLTADEKQTVSTISQLVGVVSGSVTGDSSVNAYIGNLNAENAVNNNFLTPEDRTRYNELTQKIIKGTATDKETQEWIKKAKFDQMTEELLRRHWRGEELSTAERQTLRQALREVYGKDASGVYKGEIDNYLGVANFYPFDMPDEYKIYHNKQVKESNKMRPLRNDESLLEYGLAYLQNNREMNDYEKAYNKLLKEKSLKEDSFEYSVAKGTAPAYAAAIVYYTNPLGTTGFTSKTIPGLYAQSVSESIMISNAISTTTGKSYSGYDFVADTTIGGGSGILITKGVKYLDDLAKIQSIKNPFTGKWTETTTGQGLPKYWNERLSKTGTFVGTMGGMATSQTIEDNMTKNANKETSTQNSEKITQ